MFDIKQEKKVGTIRYYPGGVAFKSLVFSKDGKSLIAAGGVQSRTPGTSTLKYWHVLSGVHLKTLEPEGQIIALTDGFFVTRDGPDQKSAKVYDLETGEKIAETKPLASRLEKADVSSDGKHLALFEHDGGVHLFELPSAKLLFTLTYAPSLRWLAFSKHEPSLTVVGGGLSLYDLKTGKGGLNRDITFFHPDAISPDGKMMAEKGPVVHETREFYKRYPDALHIQSIGKKKIIATFNVDPQWQHRQMQFTPNNRSLIAAGDRGIVRVWDVSRLEP